jgi:sugar/nucleoside kinase (ribokinase family)
VTDPDRPILCLGEAIVDLICERNLGPGQSPQTLVAHHGGALPNVAAAAARRGAAAALIGGVGSDHWGGWLIDGLAAEGVATDWIATLEQTRTPLAIALFDSSGEPSFQIYGEHIGPTMAASETFLEAAVKEGQALVVGPNTMVGQTEREVTRRAVALARSAGIPVLVDPNHRPTRWQDQHTAVGFGLELVAQSTVLKCNREEAKLFTGEDDPVAAARALARLGPRLVVVTDREREIVSAGEAEACWTPGRVDVVSPLGAGDAFMGSLAAGLADLGWDLSRVAEVLPRAAADATACCLHWGARR